MNRKAPMNLPSSARDEQAPDRQRGRIHPKAPEHVGTQDAELPVPSTRTAILVVGMHRSGTSALTRMVNLLGADLSQELMPPSKENNEAGFWESADTYRLNESLLRSAGSRWDDWTPFNSDWLRSSVKDTFMQQALAILEKDFRQSPLFVLKDPRICRLLPFWIEAVESFGAQPKCILPIRSPIEVAASLQRRDNFPSRKSDMLWLRHVLEAESGTRKMPRVLVHYRDILADWRSTAGRIADELDIAWPRRSAASEAQIDKFLEPRHRHHWTEDSNVFTHAAIDPWVRETYAAMLDLEAHADTRNSQERLDQVRAEFDRASSAFGVLFDTGEEEWHKRIGELEHVIAAKDARADQLVRERDDRAHRIGELEHRLGSRESQVSELEHVKAQREAHIDQLERERDARAQRIGALEHRLRVCDSQVAQLESANAQLESANAQLQAHAEELARERDAQADYIGELRDLRTALLLRLNEVQTAASWQLARPFRSVEYRWPKVARASAAFAKLTWSGVTLQLRQRLRDRRAAAMLLETGLFDLPWYIDRNQDILLQGLNPVLHWISEGWRAHRKPNPLFDVEYYLSRYQDVADANVNPLVHYVEYGAMEGRNPSALFDGRWYLQRYARAVGSNPLAHYLSTGAVEGLSPHPLFDAQWYLAQNPDVAQAGKDPLEHYLEFGGLERRSPHPLFDSSWYMSRYPDVAEAACNPLLHYLEFGAKEGRDPNPLFDTDWYLSENPDVGRSDINPLVHFVQYGASEGRRPNRLFEPSWYLRQHPELIPTQTNPLAHYLTHGTDSRIDPSPDFDAAGYTARQPGGIPSGVTPLAHYLASVDEIGNDQPERALVSPSGTPDSPNSQYCRVYAGLVASAGRQPAHEYYVSDTDPGLNEADLQVKVIAFYLPQFHPIPENDEWWGRGFTEWTNVSKAVPQFADHYQPHLPGELGFYDLRLPEVQARQAQLARRYGIYGFCYHYYWFGGRRLLERPLAQMLANQAINLPFCICWANENWTRRWDGQDNEILLAQEHSPEMDTRFIDDAIPLFRDPRYITVDGRPVLVVYRVNLLPEPVKTAERWRRRCRDAGVAEPFLIAAQTFGINDPRPYGFDAAVQFPPHNIAADDVTDAVSILNPQYNGRVYSYRSLRDNAVALLDKPPYKLFHCAIPSWDNEPRKPSQGHVYAGSTPRLYAEWLFELFDEVGSRPNSSERIVFVNAWNEWAEGAHLEPDRRFGYAYLRATAETLRRARLWKAFATSQTDQLRWVTAPPAGRRAEIAVVAHVYFPDLWGEMAAYLENISEEIDVFVTVAREDDAERVLAAAPANASQLFVGVVPNIGRDMAPFLAQLRVLRKLGYEMALKVHTKARSTRQDGDEWRGDMLRKLVGSAAAVDAITGWIRSDPGVGLVGPSGHLLPIEFFWGRAEEAERNLMHFRRLTAAAGLPSRSHGFVFPAGSFYWFRPRALAPLMLLGLDPLEFAAEGGQRDGTVAHALERLVGLAASTDGWRVEPTASAFAGEPSTSWIERSDEAHYPFACATEDGRAKEGPVAGIR